MSVTVNWDNSAHTLICFRISSRWTWDEFNWAWLESVAMMHSTSHKVDTIVDIADMVSLPPDLLTRTVNLVRYQPRNAGISVLTMNNGFLQLLFNSLKRIAPRESAYLRYAPNIEAARLSLALVH
jgi:hypothetical protein